ncbi:hypothetical protein REPUB_Repub07fG0027600 [Reevesia pubescens]
MDSCASVLETPDSGICSKAGQLLLLSPVFLEGELINEDNYVVADMISFKSRTSTTRPMTSSQNIDSEEETFFDSQAWLGSDFEDEFFSVKGKSGKNTFPRTSQLFLLLSQGKKFLYRTLQFFFF